jgi:catechol 2,3-dioxygenase-like lactoylglutathione lyase family enzyme
LSLTALDFATVAAPVETESMIRRSVWMSIPPPINRVLETSLYVDSLERSIAFYRLVFGLEILLHDDRMCALSVPGRQVLLLFRKGGSIRPSETEAGLIPPHDASGNQHLCFSIERDALDAWQEHLAALSIEIESRLDWRKGGSSLYFRDPDGHSIEVGTAGLWQNDPIQPH